MYMVSVSVCIQVYKRNGILGARRRLIHDEERTESAGATEEEERSDSQSVSQSVSVCACVCIYV